MAFFEAAVLALVALLVTPGWLFYFDITPKVVMLLTGAAVLLLGPRRPACRGWFSVLLLLSVVSLALSTAWSRHPALSVFGTNWRRFGLATQLAVFLFAFLSGRDVKTTLRGVSIASAAAALYGIAQYAGWDPILPASAYHIGGGPWIIVRPPGTLGYATYFANWLVMATFLAAALAAMEKRAAWRRFAWAAAAVCAVAAVLTGTRAAILAVACGAGLLALGARWARLSSRRAGQKPGGRPEGLPHKRLIAMAALLAVLAAAFYFSPAGWQLRSRTRWFREDPWGGARLMLWRDSLRMSAAHLVVGHGPEVFTAAFPAFESKKLAEAYPDFSHESPHNIFLDALVAQGLPGLLILAALCGCALRYGDRRFLPALAAGLVAQQFSVFTAPTALLFYTVLALGATRPWEPRTSRRSLFASAPVAMALMWIAIRLAVSDHSLALTWRAIAAGDLAGGAEYYRDYGRWKLPGSAADLWYSRSLAARGSLPQAIAAGESATRTAEDPFNAWYSLSALRAASNDAAGVEASLRAAIAARPNWFKPHWALARLLHLEGRVAEAQAEAALALELNHGHDAEVAETLRDIRSPPPPLQK